MFYLTSRESFIMNGVFGCHGNTYYVIFISAVFCMIHIICPINVCTHFEINRYKIDQVRKYAKIVFYLTSHADLTLLIGILIRNILKSTLNLYDFRFKCYCSNSGFRVYGDLDLDMCSIFDHTHWALCTGISMRSFMGHPSSMNG